MTQCPGGGGMSWAPRSPGGVGHFSHLSTAVVLQCSVHTTAHLSSPNAHFPCSFSSISSYFNFQAFSLSAYVGGCLFVSYSPPHTLPFSIVFRLLTVTGTLKSISSLSTVRSIFLSSCSLHLRVVLCLRLPVWQLSTPHLLTPPSVLSWSPSPRC